MSVQWAQFWSELVIEVDVHEVLRERHFLGLKMVRRYEVTVGVSEIHSVV